MASERTHDELVQEQFSRQAAQWESYLAAGGNEEVMAWIMGNLDLQPHFRVLDVAAGTGLVARQMAPNVAAAVALDATPEMLAQGRQQSEAEGNANVTFDHGDAANLPYPDNSFHLVACRLGMHHFENPRLQLQEMVRVCHPGGSVVLIDITTSDDSAAAATHNRLERLRDPSHTTAFTSDGLLALVQAAGLEISLSDRFAAHRPLDDWMDLTATPLDTRVAIAEELRQELDDGSPTGMHPFQEDGQLMFRHIWIMLVAKKPA